ncbi:hypothetical protein L226DRAFT_193662 [Lentinus tigrinus ALCF2SS1-7]|uniref:Uncharacterized protein n=1 Tax=Lentinus tigrinus ALCF2SS1-6 TaxID=1328759 RepID=A0A5C2SQY8_9APHY|nr:hypothetical protein L227DRAFT_138780 [Lentinus tigrinus ALCF2SS1-6]RPD80208.1 hypothetical protein L226DRAFT_193662 [Lentinus tigrinus ALCF2SS1-7]
MERRLRRTRAESGLVGGSEHVRGSPPRQAEAQRRGPIRSVRLLTATTASCTGVIGSAAATSTTPIATADIALQERPSRTSCPAMRLACQRCLSPSCAALGRDVLHMYEPFRPTLDPVALSSRA